MKSAHAGQSLLEVIIGIGIILTSVSTSMTLIIVTIGAGRVSQSNIEATNFAREGIEAVQFIRDSNWLRRDENIGDRQGVNPPATVRWDDSGLQSDGYRPLGANDTTNAPEYEAFRAYKSALGWTLNQQTIPGGSPPDPANINPQSYTIYRQESGGTLWFTQNPCGATCIPTKYSRIILIRRGTEDIDPGAGVTNVDYLDVLSEVVWHERSGNDTKYASQFNRRVSAQRRFYDWRQ